MLIPGGSGSGKINALLYIINRKLCTNEIYLYAKDLYEVKYHFLINKWESAGLSYCGDFKAFIEYSNDMDYIYKDFEEYNPNKEGKILIGFNDSIDDMIKNKKSNPVLTEPFIRGKKLNISLVFIA